MYKKVLEIANQFTKKPKHVWISDSIIDERASFIKGELKDDNELMGRPNIPKPTHEPTLEESDIAQVVLYELMASSVNYKYWYGKHDIRPNDSCANKMYQVLDDSFSALSIPETISSNYCTGLVDVFTANLALERFPMMKDRSSNLAELKRDILGRGDPKYPPNASFFANQMAKDILDGSERVDEWLKTLITSFPGFGQDIFLKRAFLFFMMLNRRMGWFSNDIHKLPIPADYQIPKILRGWGCLKYGDELCGMIDNSELIPQGSLMECEIRASSIIACQRLSERASVTMSDVDNYIWINRKSCSDPFHLTITTDY